MSQFELVFKGKLAEGFTLDQVRDNVATLFKASSAQIEQMFSGNSVVLRNGLDSATAEKYQALFQKNGALCIIRKMDHAVISTQAESAGNDASAKVKSASGFPIAGEKIDEILANVDWHVAPLGTRMEEERENIPLPEVDLSHLSIAPTGSDMGEKKQAKPPPTPDTSHIKLKA